RQRDWAEALDAAARPAAIAEAMPTAAIGASVLGAVVAGIALAHTVAPTTLAVLMLLPLSAFEATTPLPAAAVQLTRSRIAARRLLELAPPDRPTLPGEAAPAGGSLCVDVRSGHDGASRAVPVRLDLPPGARLAITGASGSGKTTLLMTLAGLIPPLDGRVTLNGTDLSRFDEDELHRAVSFFAEDAHVFATTVRDNLLVARGDCGDDELTATLEAVGLGGWLAGLPEGLSTVLTGGAQALSAGQRRRLLLARAVIAPACIVLLDEPTEHLDAADAERVLRELLGPRSTLMSAERTVVVATHHLPKGIGCRELRLTGGAGAA
ncbi:ATP-binding cassette domain-containing protein, partial [Mycobacterium sp. E3198]|uniref:ATP-binding cassette domain-containing protein n=1 Tax=Mycobacterium sp. E3198 TaxID=1834143 RepID=UPI000AC1B5B1